MLPAITWLSAAPMQTAVVMAPSVRLKRPEPRVRSADSDQVQSAVRVP
jgi:hypothetical protein